MGGPGPEVLPRAFDDTGPLRDGSHAVTPTSARAGQTAKSIFRAMRPTQWLKNGVLLAGLIFGSKLFDPTALAKALLAVMCFSALSGGFYLVNDVRDVLADRAHPSKRWRPVAAGELSTTLALRAGITLIALSIVASALLGSGFTLALIAYSLLMAAYNLGLKQIVIIDVFAIATGFVIRAAAGAIAVDVTISPWLLLCTMLLALLISFGKRRYELVFLEDAARHRRNLESYTQALLDQAVAITASGTLIAYAVYTFEAEAAPRDHRMMLTIPVVAYGIFRYLYLLYRRGDGGAPETMLLADRGLLGSIAVWGLMSAFLFYSAR
jgi:4-hydroxybenzoate polyprenyltransferase